MATVTPDGVKTASTLLACVILAACAPPQTKRDPAHVTLPGAGETERKQGLWEQRLSDGQTTQVTRLCLNGDAHLAMAYLGESLNRDLCSKRQMVRGANGAWTFSSTCAGPSGAQVTTAGTASGDYTSHYQLKLQRSQTGGVTPGVRNYVLDAAWKGACPPDMKSGDMVLADGRKAAISQVNPSKGW
jgi:hypothetical protein